MTVFIRVDGGNADSRDDLLGRTEAETDSGMTGQCLYKSIHLKQMCARSSRRQNITQQLLDNTSII